MKAILYCRVATDEQANKYSLNLQEEKLKTHCQENEIKIIAIYREGSAGTNFNNRPELKNLKEYIKERKGEVNHLIVTTWDRLGRNPLETFQLIDELQGLGVQPYSIEQPLDMTLPESKLMLAIYLGLPYNNIQNN